MITVLYAVLGMTTGAAVLYAALGLMRPLDRTYLSFAWVMAMLAAFVFWEAMLYGSTTSEAAIETVRRQVLARHGLLAAVLVFVPKYTHVKLPRRLLTAYWVGLGVLALTNLVAPFGIWYSAAPEPAPATFLGQPHIAVVAPSLSVLRYAHTTYVLCVYALMFTCAGKLIRRGERQRGTMLAVSLSLAVVAHAIDVVRDMVGGTWPYLAEFGLVTWGLMMSVQLAIEYRVSEQRLHSMLASVEQHAAELARMVEETLRVRDKLNTPLQTLELGLAERTSARASDEHTLADLRDAVTQITLLGRAVEQTTDPHRIGRPP